MRPDLPSLSFLGTAAASLAVVLAVACRESPVAPRGDSVRPSQVQLKKSRVPPTDLLSPVRIALGEGRLYVSDFSAGAVFEVKMSAGRMRIAGSFPVAGRPLGVAYANGYLLIGDAETGAVDVYGTRGKNKGTRLYSLLGDFSDPTDIAIDAARDLVFVLDGFESKVKVFRLSDGSVWGTISGPGSTDVALQNPTGIAVDPARQEVIVSDYGDPAASGLEPALKVFSYDGSWVSKISGKAGMFGRRFSRPQGLAVDASGRILMVEAMAGEVQILDRETGELLETLGAFGDGPGQLRLPLDVVVGADGRVYVTNNRPGRVEEFSLGGAVQ